MEALIQEISTLTQGVLVWLFVIVVCLDITTGYAKAFITKTFTSREATDGLIRQVVRSIVFFALVGCSYLFKSQPTPAIDSMLALIQTAFIVAYVRSLIENYRAMDLNFFEDLIGKKK